MDPAEHPNRADAKPVPCHDVAAGRGSFGALDHAISGWIYPRLLMMLLTRSSGLIPSGSRSNNSRMVWSVRSVMLGRHS